VYDEFEEEPEDTDIPLRVLEMVGVVRSIVPLRDRRGDLGADIFGDVTTDAFLAVSSGVSVVVKAGVSLR
jgi:hypothetical protein